MSEYTDTTNPSGADVIIHLDLNKTILAVDEVKNYGADEVVYLEQWKSDPDFLNWRMKHMVVMLRKMHGLLTLKYRRMNLNSLDMLMSTVVWIQEGNK